MEVERIGFVRPIPDRPIEQKPSSVSKRMLQAPTGWIA